MDDSIRGSSERYARYVVTRRLARSWPHFTLYEALQEGLDRRVELRVFTVPPRTADESVRRFEREYKTLCKLDHPHILKILDLGVAEGRPFYVTDLRIATSVGELLLAENRPLPVERVLQLACDIGGALAYLHARDVLHRNLSTDSIFWDEENRFFYIGEFSMGKDQSLDDITDLGVPELYPLIETPESLSGGAEDGRGDLFLLGRVLYQALTLRTPTLDGGSGRATIGLTALHHAQVRTFNDEVPTTLEDMVLRLLAPEPAERYQTAAEFVDEATREQRRHQGRIVLADERQRTIARMSSEFRRPKRRPDDAGDDEPPSTVAGLTGTFADLPPSLRYGLLLSLVPLLALAYELVSGHDIPPPTRVSNPVTTPSAAPGPQVVRTVAPRPPRPVDDFVLAQAGPTTPEAFHQRWALLLQWRRSFPVDQQSGVLRYARLKSARTTFAADPRAGCEELDLLFHQTARRIREMRLTTGR